MSEDNDKQISNRLRSMYSQIGEEVLRQAMVKLLGTEISNVVNKYEIEQAVKESVRRGLSEWCDANIVPALHAKLNERRTEIIEGASDGLDRAFDILRNATRTQISEVIKDPKYSKSVLHILLGMNR